MSRVLVLNPNSDQSLTAKLTETVHSHFDCSDVRVEGLAAGPKGIITPDDIKEAERLALQYVQDQGASISALVIACFADPGVKQLREFLEIPVFGIARAGLFAALAYSAPTGVISTTASVIQRHWHYYRNLGIAELVAADVSAEILPGVDYDDQRVRNSLLRAAAEAVSEGAKTIVLGCAAFAPHRAWLQHETGVPVTDPVLAGTALALGLCSGLGQGALNGRN